MQAIQVQFKAELQHNKPSKRTYYQCRNSSIKLFPNRLINTTSIIQAELIQRKEVIQENILWKNSSLYLELAKRLTKEKKIYGKLF